MTEGSRFFLYLLLGVTGLFTALLVLSLGPLGWVATAFLVIGALAYSSWHGEGGSDRPNRTNCAACGSPNAADSEVCGYCGEPLE